MMKNATDPTKLREPFGNSIENPVFFFSRWKPPVRFQVPPVTEKADRLLRRPQGYGSKKEADKKSYPMVAKGTPLKTNMSPKKWPFQ